VESPLEDLYRSCHLQRLASIRAAPRSQVGINLSMVGRR